MENTIGNKLIESGIYPNLKGFHHIVSAVEIYHTGMPIVKLYEEIVKANGDTSSRVERAIRHAKDKNESNKTFANGEYIALLKYELEN